MELQLDFRDRESQQYLPMVVVVVVGTIVPD
jgi:hypothetical protein